MTCTRCGKESPLFDPLACVVSAYEGDPRPVFVRLCAEHVAAAITGGAMVELDVIGACPSFTLARLNGLVGRERMPKETGYYTRLAQRRGDTCAS